MFFKGGASDVSVGKDVCHQDLVTCALSHVMEKVNSYMSFPAMARAAPQKLHTHPLDKCNKNAFKARQDKVTAQSLSASMLGELWRTEGLEAAEYWVPAENSSLLCLPLAPPHRLGQGREGAARGPAPLGG